MFLGCEVWYLKILKNSSISTWRTRQHRFNCRFEDLAGIGFIMNDGPTVGVIPLGIHVWESEGGNIPMRIYLAPKLLAEG